MDAELTAAAQGLLASCVDSTGALDLLLLLHQTRDRDWSVEELCGQLRCPGAWAEDQLARLAAAGLVTIADRYRYRRGQRYGAAVDELARACRRDRATVVALIFSRPPRQPVR